MAAVVSLAVACGEPPGGEDRPSAAETNATGPSASASPSPPPRFTFAAKGDWGAGTPEQAAVTGRMCEVRKATPFDVVVTTGDNFYRPDGTATQSNYYGPEGCLLEHPGHQWRATWGNHDSGRPSTAGVLGAEERYYTWTAQQVQFFMLDSNRVADPTQTAWLESELAGSRAPVKIVVFHHPPFTVGLHENNVEVRRRWVPLFERHGVDLVLNGHNHGYEHSLVNGVHYVVTGGGGAQLYPCVDSQPWLKSCLSVNHFLLVEVEGQALTVAALGTDGRAVDRFGIGRKP
ncbi:MAG TPA: metallophosphoesterase [Actinomycetota bacterium]|nr:metallophosphoesterase [Actinomycetota bacterium]